MSIVIHKELNGANGRNWPGFIILNPNAKFPAAVFAQEYYESLHKLNPINLLAVKFNKDARREMEIQSHEIEVMTAFLIYDADPNHYRFKEATAMTKGYDGLFKNYSVQGLVQAMHLKNDKARDFFEKHQKRIESYK